MVRPNTAVYDSNIRAFFLLRSVGTVKDQAEKLRRLIADHDALTREYDRVLEQGLLTGAIEHLRAKFNLKASVYSDTKVIDTDADLELCVVHAPAATRGRSVPS